MLKKRNKTMGKRNCLSWSVPVLKEFQKPNVFQHFHNKFVFQQLIVQSTIKMFVYNFLKLSQHVV